jgi:hypothetical protein
MQLDAAATVLDGDECCHWKRVAPAFVALGSFAWLSVALTLARTSRRKLELAATIVKTMRDRVLKSGIAVFKVL